MSEMMPCPRPRCRGHLRQHVNVFVECSVAAHDLSKSGIRRRDVKILGAGWDTAIWFCTSPRCGYVNRLSAHPDVPSQWSPSARRDKKTRR